MEVNLLERYSGTILLIVLYIRILKCRDRLSSKLGQFNADKISYDRTLQSDPVMIRAALFCNCRNLCPRPFPKLPYTLLQYSKCGYILGIYKLKLKFDVGEMILIFSAFLLLGSLSI